VAQEAVLPPIRSHVETKFHYILLRHRWFTNCTASILDTCGSRIVLHPF